MTHEVLCYGQVIKTKSTRKECENYVAMQRSKIKGAGLTHDGKPSNNPAYAATCIWKVQRIK